MMQTDTQSKTVKMLKNQNEPTIQRIATMQVMNIIW
jgi:hypothetical protein